MEVRFLRAGHGPDRAAWLQAWQRTVSREPFCHPDYCALFAGPAAVAGAFLAQQGTAQAIVPLVLRDLGVEPPTGAPLREITLPVGYGGAYRCTGGPPLPAAEFWRRFEEWARANSVVCAYTRLTLYPDELLPMPGWTVVPACDNVVVDLDDHLRRGRAGFTSSLRRNVRLAARAGVTCARESSPEAFAAFHDLYRETMHRRGARPDYQFSSPFFDRLAAQVRDGRGGLFVARDQAGAPLCAEVLLWGRRRAFAFLAGSNAAGRGAHAHEALRAYMCEWLVQGRWRELVLGGGNRPDDPLFQHKLRFAPYGRRAYRKGRRIFDHPAYRQLVRRRRDAGWDGSAAGEFPAYRSVAG